MSIIFVPVFAPLGFQEVFSCFQEMLSALFGALGFITGRYDMFKRLLSVLLGFLGVFSR
jgi:hypothetical protein